MNNKRLIILGASGHASIVAEIAQQAGYSLFCLDDDKSKLNTIINGIQCNGEIETLKDYSPINFCVALAIGNNELRKKLYNFAKKLGFTLPTLVHEKACISKSATIGEGTLICANSVVNAWANIGNGVIVNTGAIIEHHNAIHDFSHISPGATLCGNVSVGELTWCGANSTVIESKKITSNVTIAAGSTVISNINQAGVYIGSPAQLKKIK